MKMMVKVVLDVHVDAHRTHIPQDDLAEIVEGKVEDSLTRAFDQEKGDVSLDLVSTEVIWVEE